MQLKNYQQRSLEVLQAYFQAVIEKNDADTAFYETTRRFWGQGIPYREVAELPGLPYVCLRVPTGGGKTLMACEAVGIAAKDYLHSDHILVLWLAPSKVIRDQTLKALKDRSHPYRQAVENLVGAVSVITVEEAQYIQPASLSSETVILVSTTQAFRVEDPELRKVYEASGALMSHFDTVSPTANVDRYAGGKPVPSLGNLLRMHRPVVIVDEAQNVRSPISFETLARFNPACILEFTATPKTGQHASNVLYSISARELKAEEMIKLPIRLSVRPQWKEMIGEAVQTLRGLEVFAEGERARSGEYIRPIMLLQAQPRYTHRQSITVEAVETCLKDDYSIPAEQIAIATGEKNQIEGVDLYALDCPVRYIITVAALREGWDCAFAYVLCSVAEQHGATAVEQIVGRVLRLPKAKRKQAAELNMAYAFVSSQRFEQTLNNLKDALVANGFERQEADSLVVSEPAGGFGPLFNYQALGGETLAFQFDEAPRREMLPAELARKVSYDAASQTIQIEASITLEEEQKLKESFTVKETRAAFVLALENAKIRNHTPNPTPSQRGEEFSVPALAVRQGDFFEQFEETHFLDFEWELSRQEAGFDESEFSAQPPAPRWVDLDVNAQGKIQTQFLPDLQQQMQLLKVDLGWSAADLVVWLDRNIYHPDIPLEESHVFLTRMLLHLTGQRCIPLDDIVRQKYRLRDAAAKKIDQHRRAAKENAFRALLGKETLFKVSAETVFTYDREDYPCPVQSLHRGSHRFRKHYYPEIGDLKSDGEEFECAQFIDSLEEVKCWVRNIDSQPRLSFWLQISTGHFYPDFVCKLKDGRILVVEYKGAHLYTDAEEKRVIGELWERRSKGKCLFVMPTEREFGVVGAKIRG